MSLSLAPETGKITHVKMCTLQNVRQIVLTDIAAARNVVPLACGIASSAHKAIRGAGISGRAG
jgi:hypothetical protein